MSAASACSGHWSWSATVSAGRRWPRRRWHASAPGYWNAGCCPSWWKTASMCCRRASSAPRRSRRRWRSTTRCWAACESAQLAVLAAAPVVDAEGGAGLVPFTLAGHAQTHAGQRRAARLGNGGVAFLAMGQALAPGQLATGALDGVLDAAVDLFLYRAVTGPAAGHVAPPEGNPVRQVCTGQARDASGSGAGGQTPQQHRERPAGDQHHHAQDAQGIGQMIEDHRAQQGGEEDLAI